MENLAERFKESQRGWQNEVNKMLKRLMARIYNQEQLRREVMEEHQRRATEEIRDFGEKLAEVEREAAKIEADLQNELKYLYGKLTEISRIKKI